MATARPLAHAQLLFLAIAFGLLSVWTARRLWHKSRQAVTNKPPRERVAQAEVEGAR